MSGMTAQQMGARLQTMADEVNRAISAQRGQIAGALADASNYCAQLQLAAEEPTTEVAGMLGEDHNGTTAIVGNTANVTEALEGVVGKLQGAIADLETITSAADQLSFVYMNVGADIMRSSQ
jgi:ethanolamine transporter EutH